MSTNTVAANTITEYETRKQIITLANSLIGSHYLLGAGGDAPMTNTNGVPYGGRGIMTDMVKPSKDINTLAIKAAACWGAGSRYVCTGRYHETRYMEVDPANTNSADYKELKTYLDGLDAAAPDKWTDHNGLYPRKVVGKGVTRMDNVTSIESKIVWGEDCSSKQHFDCVYFCMYCYWKVVPNVNWWMEIMRWATNDQLLKTIPLDQPMWPGDIVIVGPPTPTTNIGDYHHIGMYDGRLLDGTPRVIEALMAAAGVVSRPWNEQSFTLCRRVKSGVLPNTPG